MDHKDLGNLLITTIVLIVIILVILAVFAIKTILFQKNLQQGKLKLASGINIDNKTNEKSFFIMITNHTFNNIILSSCGLVYKLHNYDYLDDYKQSINLTKNEEAYINQRDSISFTIPYSALYDKFIDKYVSTIYIYSIDKLGKVSKKKAKTLTKQLQYEAYLIRKAEQEKQKELDRITKENQKEIKKINGKADVTSKAQVIKEKTTKSAKAQVVTPSKVEEKPSKNSTIEQAVEEKVVDEVKDSSSNNE